MGTVKAVRVAICDDEAYFLTELEKLVSASGNEYERELDIHTYLKVGELVKDVVEEHKEYDLLFLDVEMPELSGAEAAKKLRKAGFEGVICFVTSHRSYAMAAYEVEALGYVIKPAKYTELKRLMHKALIQIHYQRDSVEAGRRYLEVATKKEKMMVDTQNILYVEKRGNQCVVHLEDGEVVCYISLKHLFTQLNQEKFCYVHQGYVVNFDKIKEVKKEAVCFGEGREIPVSRRYQPGLKIRHMDKIYRLRQEKVNN